MRAAGGRDLAVHQGLVDRLTHRQAEVLRLTCGGGAPIPPQGQRTPPFRPPAPVIHHSGWGKGKRKSTQPIIDSHRMGCGQLGTGTNRDPDRLVHGQRNLKEVATTVMIEASGMISGRGGIQPTTAILKNNQLRAGPAGLADPLPYPD